MRAPFAPWAVIAVLGITTGSGCLGCGGAVKRPYPTPAKADVLAALEARNRDARSLRAESTMDYRVDGDRVKGTVLIAGKRGARIRFNAENPTGGSVAVDLACDGISFQYVNYNANCQLVGPCTEDAIAQLLRVRLEPDEFLLLAIGGVPLLDYEDAQLEWNAKDGRERLTLSAADGSRQIIELAGNRDKRWEVVKARTLAPNGELEWRVQNKDFRDLKSEDGVVYRVPKKTLFEQPPISADLLVEWKERSINVELPETTFAMQIPEGLPVCGAKK